MEAAHRAALGAGKIVLDQRRQARRGPIVGAERLEEEASLVGERFSLDEKKAGEAAEIMGITAARLKTLGLIDKEVTEPTGGAHRDYKAMSSSLKKALTESLRQVADLSTTDLLARRFERLMAYGKYKEQAVA